MKSVLLLGATGSIGTTFLTALRNHPELDIRIAVLLNNKPIAIGASSWI